MVTGKGGSAANFCKESLSAQAFKKKILNNKLSIYLLITYTITEIARLDCRLY